MVSALTSPENVAIPAHFPGPSAGRSIETEPENDATSAKPLMAPTHSGGSVLQAPSTHVPPWKARIEMVRGAKSDDSSVPIQVPATFAGPAGAGLVGPGVGDGEVGVGATMDGGEVPPPQPNTRTAATRHVPRATNHAP
jgi:hypothetical protein